MTELFPREGQFIHPALGLIPQPNAFEKKHQNDWKHERKPAK